MKPLIFFVHVPKTAGTTVNAGLHRELPDGITHCEAIIRDDVSLKRAASECDWLSGHVSLPNAEARLREMTDRPVRFFACVRRPVDQVRSHYNWLIEIYRRGPAFYEPHPRAIRDISETIRRSRHDPASIIDILDHHAGLFLNCQSKWILGTEDARDEAEIHRRLARYEAVMENDRIEDLLGRMVGRPVAVTRRENASKYHFPTGAFESPEMTDFLKRRNNVDERLFAAVRRQAATAAA